MALAIWFHDTVYEPTQQDNELQSAALARECLIGQGFQTESVSRIIDLILATHHYGNSNDLDTEIFMDIDLSILGTDPVRFDEYERQIRAEYAWVSDVVYCRERGRVLQGFVDRSFIYI